MRNDLITRALESLKLKLDEEESSFNYVNKEEIKKLIDKVLLYYDRKYDDIVIYQYNNQNKLYELSSELTEIITEINYIVDGLMPIDETKEKIYKKIHYDSMKNRFKERRLNNE